MDCPFCGDRRGRMNVNFVMNVWRCNHCDAHGGMLALYAEHNHTTTSEAYWEIAEALCDNTHEEHARSGNEAPQQPVSTGSPSSGARAAAAGHSSSERKTVPQSNKASPAEIHQTLSLLLAQLTLRPAHREHLRSPKRGLSDEQIAALDKESYRLASQQEKLNEANDSLVDYMWNEYELTYSYALELRDETMENLGEIKKQIHSLKSDIRGLGDVNVNAIEEYIEVNDRYIFLKTQHDDLITAEQSLIQVIEDLDTGMRIQFEEKFKEIKTEFNKVFQELFGGGRGTIELVEGEDILEAGIVIISQPPGKKLQNMMQLSGGEKALTAISLLVAIQNLKPSPFCLLDEIEAALDDSNVGRYANYLHKLTKHTQFIVITHRRGTMAAADRLYGITMQEKGVSALVSVDLIADDLEKEKPAS